MANLCATCGGELVKRKNACSRHSLKCKLKQGVGQVKSAIHILGEELPGVARLADEDFVCHPCYCLLSRVWAAKVGLDDLCSQFRANKEGLVDNRP